MKPWEQYQHRTAELLGQLGFTTKVNDPLHAPNGVVHRVDVSARMTVAGVSMLWVAECKLWNRAVTKEKVSALKDIVNDLGADRGLLISEKGFQSGAVRLAAAKNITLSSLDELRANAAKQVISTEGAELRLWSIMGILMQFRHVPRWVKISEEERADFAQRPAATDFLECLIEVANRKGYYDGNEEKMRTILTDTATYGVWKDGIDAATINEATSMSLQVMVALDRAKIDYWPVPFETPDGPKLAWSIPQLLDLVEPAITQLARRVHDAYEKLLPADVRNALRTMRQKLR